MKSTRQQRADMRAAEALRFAAVEAAELRRLIAGGCLGDSADALARARAAIHCPEAVTVVTRCAGYEGGHSTWGYGPIYVNRKAAKAAGHRHSIECSCGVEAYPL